jgi:hypothetical protein
MWLFTTAGFFSIVAKGGRDFQVRARARKDLVRLNHTAKLRLEIIETPHADYRFRVEASAAEVQRMLFALFLGIDYSNFKSAVGEIADQRDKLGPLHTIWREMFDYQQRQLRPSLPSRFGTGPIWRDENDDLPFGFPRGAGFDFGDELRQPVGEGAEGTSPGPSGKGRAAQRGRNKGGQSRRPRVRHGQSPVG